MGYTRQFVALLGTIPGSTQTEAHGTWHIFKSRSGEGVANASCCYMGSDVYKEGLMPDI